METVERIITRFSRALDSYDLHADAQQQICRKLTGILSRYTDIHFQRALEIGCGTGGFTRLLKESCVIDEWYLNDIYRRKCGRDRLSRSLRPDRIRFRISMDEGACTIPS